MMDLEEQENKMTYKLECLINRFAYEYAIKKLKMAVLLEQKKQSILGFMQVNEIEELEDDGEY